MVRRQPEATPEEPVTGSVVAEVWKNAPSPFSTEQLAKLDSVNDVMALMEETYGGTISAHETEYLGDGFRLAKEEDKRRLCGVPLLFIEWRFNESDYGDVPYVSAKAIQFDGDTGKVTGKWILNDGSTGVATQLREFTVKTGRTGGLGVRRGLRVSDYPTDAKTGTPLSKADHRTLVQEGKPVGKGTTFYLDTSA
jgi:hypothetical protein